MKDRISTVALAGTLSIGLALAGCSGGSQNDSEASPAPADSSQSQGTDESATSEDATSPESDQSDSGLSKDADLSKESPGVSAEDAVKTAQEEVKAKDGTLHAVELDFDSDDGKWEYDIKILDGTTDHKVVIDADTGDIIRDESEDSDDTEKSIDLTSPMTFDEAFDLASEKASGKLTGWKLEYDDGQREYQFDFDDNGSEIEVTVNVESKKVTVD